MLVLTLFGLIFLFFSLLFFFYPEMIVKISEIGNKLIFTDHSTVAHRYWSGGVLLIMSLLMFYLGFIHL